MTFSHSLLLVASLLLVGTVVGCGQPEPFVIEHQETITPTQEAQQQTAYENQMSSDI
ncbi:hypothetical protein CA13_49170 [Planctomycetes bacterium CA13]|uniref:Uncharacterized protein n=1 Tax=Novipirellula herctigrandis TaxID=2527986 RepID=A0A5C5Z827_9BACT|nr:hypothetical protein CA13_49170 [Planctomycetes bacterium CA13]